MIAFPCRTFSISRFFDASTENGRDSGPPVIRTFDHPDGLPEEEIDPKKHIRELKLSNLLLARTVEIAIAARKSPAKTTIIVENPADRSPGASVASAPEFAEHGSLFRTDAFKRLVAEAELTGFCTFAYCRLGSERQKYTSLAYTPEAGAVLDALNSPDFQCNHERGAHTKRAGGRGTDGNFISADAAPYPPVFVRNCGLRQVERKRPGEVGDSDAVEIVLLPKFLPPFNKDRIAAQVVEIDAVFEEYRLQRHAVGVAFHTSGFK